MNVTPLIDVVMCLIVFHLMVGHLVLERRGTARLPVTAVGTDEQRKRDPAVITVRRDGAVLLDGVETQAERVESAMAGRIAREPGLAVQVRADRELDFARVRPVLAGLQRAGVRGVELATERQP